MQHPQKINFKTNLKILEISLILVIGVFRRLFESFPTIFHHLYQCSTQKQKLWEKSVIKNVTMWRSK